MSKKNNRMRRINRMLLEMAGGNFFFRLERSNKNDNLEAMTVILNMLAEEIQESLVYQGHKSPRGITENIIQMCFAIDEEGIIEMVNENACLILSDLSRDIIDKPFELFLTSDSKEKWVKTLELLKRKNYFDTSLKLTFKSSENLLIPNTCFITTFKKKKTNRRQTLLTVIHQTKSAYELEKELKKSVLDFKNQKDTLFEANIISKPQKPKLSSDDLIKIRNGRNFIVNNLEKEIPNLKEFALQLGTNEFKLKYGFKELYGVSVHHYIMTERLRKAKMLVQYSKLTLKTIAFKVGFKSFPHFSRVFKKRYEYAPSALRKKSQDTKS